MIAARQPDRNRQLLNMVSKKFHLKVEQAYLLLP